MLSATRGEDQRIDLSPQTPNEYKEIGRAGLCSRVDHGEKLMFIQTEATPNPATLKFLPGRAVLADGTLDMPTAEEAAQSPLAERLFEISGVSGVFLGSDFITVTKGAGEWQHLKPAILGAIMEHFMSEAPIVRAEVKGPAAAEGFFAAG